MTERMASADDRFGGWIQGADSKDAVKMVEATVQLGGDITKESFEEMQIVEALKELRGAKGNVWRREYHFRSIHRRQRPICIVILRR